jgi:hypothetical protein
MTDGWSVLVSAEQNNNNISVVKRAKKQYDDFNFGFVIHDRVRHQTCWLALVREIYQQEIQFVQ